VVKFVCRFYRSAENKGIGVPRAPPSTPAGVIEMYYSQWGLDESPFPTIGAGHAYYPSPTHEEALARLHFLVEQHRHFGLLLGERGSGKSLVLSVFADQCRRAHAAVVRCNLTAVSSHEFPWLVAEQLGLTCSSQSAVLEVWRRLDDRLVEIGYERRSVVVLLDDVQRAAGDVLDQVRRLMHFDSVHGSPLTVIFAAPSNAAGQIPSDFHELAALRIELEPWQVDDTHAFLSSVVAGTEPSMSVFDEDAVRRIQENAQGNPRRVVQLADLALLVGAGEEAARVGEQIVAKAAEQLVLVTDS
jgi:type II secretory pathway predicted ATPase ExeA